MKSASIVKYVLFIISSSILIGAAYIYLDKKAFSERAIMSEGTVIGSSVSISSGKEYYHPVITFKTNKEKNIKFIASASGHSPIYGVGESVEIIYDPAYPEEAMIKQYFSVTAIPILLICVSVLSFFTLFIFSFSHKKAKYIFENGTRIITQFDSIKRTRTHIIKGRLLCQICTTYRDPNTDKVRVFKSAKILMDPTGFIKSKNITVILHPENPKKYLMDISFLT
ncbi:hypothetical protein BSF41_32670 [Flavobacterium sp. ACN2]|jgi:hypothetical protein|uniref:DUF3592 domain-containing protein n=1 Tax=unclassified Flavobacterium TaxID=196869 RepID=UPI000BB3B685|nr:MULTISPECIES: DUF3592 domain-containing protein [unclassified Flavobacterium]MDY0985876.1 DUF3592 domain-containing protein [Flavobacterium sp. CFBP9031]PBI86810.1 hypothetical protein BSF41_32670 [Flavobacterium sp. ACN2]